MGARAELGASERLPLDQGDHREEALEGLKKGEKGMVWEPPGPRPHSLADRARRPTQAEAFLSRAERLDAGKALRKRRSTRCAAPRG